MAEITYIILCYAENMKNTIKNCYELFLKIDLYGFKIKLN